MAAYGCQCGQAFGTPLLLRRHSAECSGCHNAAAASDAATHRAAALDMMDSGDCSSAAAAFAAAIEHFPSDWTLQLGLAEALLRLDRPADAADATVVALTLQPTAARAWLRRGQALRQLGRFADGLRAVAHGMQCDCTETPALQRALEREQATLTEDLEVMMATLGNLLNTSVTCQEEMVAVCSAH